VNGPAEDRDLREAFERLRLFMHEPGQSPAFRPMLERAGMDGTSAPTPTPTRLRSLPPRAGPRPWLRSGSRAVLAAAAALVVLLAQGARDPELEFQRLVSAYGATALSWRPPTSRLLEVPGLELVRSLPAIGAPLLDAVTSETGDHPVPAPEVRS
jgi:hypothetical protein